MVTLEFNNNGAKAVWVEFNCKVCPALVVSEHIGVPEPNFAADTSPESASEEESSAVCPKCEEIYEIDITSEIGGGWLTIHNLDDKHPTKIFTEYESDDIE